MTARDRWRITELFGTDLVRQDVNVAGYGELDPDAVCLVDDVGFADQCA
jgi:hypothetical protein